MIILALDTSGKVASSALLRDGQIIGSERSEALLDHSRMILPGVERVLARAGIAIGEVDVFCAVTGPGSFTGIRIGVAAVKGFCFALDKPCFGVSSLESAAYSPALPDGICCALVHAREHEFYYARFARHGGSVTKLCEEKAASAALIADLIEENQALCGSGAGLFAEKTGRGNVFADALGAHAAAKSAYAAAQTGRLISGDALTPFYMKPAQAERLASGRG